MSNSAWADLSHVNNVGVIGAGIAGLQMARSLEAQGFQCTIFDKAPEPGGLWRDNFVGYGLQVLWDRFTTTRILGLAGRSRTARSQ